MSRQNDSMIDPKIEELLDRVDSKFSLVTLAAYRARQINSYFGQLGDGLGHMIPPQVSSVARKPLSIAFDEIAADKIVKVARPDYEEMQDEATAMFGEIPDNVDASTFALLQGSSSDDVAVDEAPASE